MTEKPTHAPSPCLQRERGAGEPGSQAPWGSHQHAGMASTPSNCKQKWKIVSVSLRNERANNPPDPVFSVLPEECKLF